MKIVQAAVKKREKRNLKMLKITILTASDSRNAESDASGKLLAQLFKQKAQARLLQRKVVPDDIVALQEAFLKQELLKPDLILVNGGTGVAIRDVSIQAIKPLLREIVPGFGEAFRRISYDEIGTRGLASRALCGFNYYNQLCYCVPGSTNACQTAAIKLILPEYKHLLFERSSKRKEIHHHAH